MRFLNKAFEGRSRSRRIDDVEISCNKMWELTERKTLRSFGYLRLSPVLNLDRVY